MSGNGSDSSLRGAEAICIDVSMPLSLDGEESRPVRHLSPPRHASSTPKSTASGWISSTKRLAETVTMLFQKKTVHRLEASDESSHGTLPWLDPNRPADVCDKTLLDSNAFKYAISFTIVANVAQLGASVELKDDTWDKLWVISDHMFTCAFLVEMLVKVFILEVAYFKCRWTLVDFALVFLGVADCWILPAILSPSDATHLDTLKLFRLLRLARIIKLMRMRRELHVLLEGMLDSVRSMIWVGVLLTVIIYTFAIFCILVLGDSLEEPTGLNYFGDIPRAMLSLFNMALLTDWSNIIWPVYEMYPAVTLALILFVVVTSLGVLNVIIGLIVERTNAAAEKMSMEDRELERRTQLDAVGELTKMMRELDANHDGWLSLDEMGSAVDNIKFTDLMKQINLPLGFGLRDLYLMLDTDMNSKVTRKEFVDGMYRIVHCNEFQRTCLSHLSIAQVKRQIKQAHKETMHEMHRLRQEQQDLAQEMRNGLDEVVQAIAKLQRS